MTQGQVPPFVAGSNLENEAPQQAQINLAGKPHLFAINIVSAVFGRQWAGDPTRTSGPAKQCAVPTGRV